MIKYMDGTSVSFSVFGEQYLLGYAILAAIPLVIFAIYVEDLRQRFFHLFGDSAIQARERDEEVEVGFISNGRVFGGVFLVVELIFYLGNSVAREKAPLPSLGVFVAALFAQGFLQKRFESAISPVPAKQASSDNFSLMKSITWLLASLVFYFLILNSFIFISVYAASQFGLDEKLIFPLVGFGCLVGVFIGLFVTYGLSPFFLRRILPSHSPQETNLINELRVCFTKNGVKIPNVWIVDSEKFQWNNILIGGFFSSISFFQPAIFISGNLARFLTVGELKSLVFQEIAHIKLSHISKRFLYTGLSIVGAVVVSMLFFGGLIRYFDSGYHLWIKFFAFVIALGIPYFSVKSLIKRHEFKADLYSIKKLGGNFSEFATALRKMDMLNEIWTGNLRKGDEGELLGTPLTEKRIRRLRKKLKIMAGLPRDRSEDKKIAA